HLMYFVKGKLYQKHGTGICSPSVRPQEAFHRGRRKKRKVYTVFRDSLHLTKGVIDFFKALILPFFPLNVNKQFMNNYLIKVFSYKFAWEIEHSTKRTKKSLKVELNDWQQVEKFLFKKKGEMPQQVRHGSVHCTAAHPSLRLEEVDRLLNKREIKSFTDNKVSFAIYQFQRHLFLVIRSTVQKSGKDHVGLAQ
uniref:WD repeat domain 17 n=1 Tax=Macaca mulatta TaxID=9544 RepID=A0A5F7Z787_MACMU